MGVEAKIAAPAGSGGKEDLAAEVLRLADQRNISLSVAESCTGGALAALLTDVEGLSSRFERGYVCYSDASKTDMLDVPKGLIDLEGPVTAPVAKLMAKGAQYRSGADLAIAITGFAGPAGPDDEPGLIHLATYDRDGKLNHEEHHFAGSDRQAVRDRAIRAALAMLLARLKEWPRGNAPREDRASFLLAGESRVVPPVGGMRGR